MTAFATYAFNSTIGTSPRTMPDRLDDVLNVKEFGAVGDGSNDDTTAIQNALDAAFGPVDNPHRVTNRQLNKPIYFPNNIYLVRAPAAMSVSAMSRGSDATITGWCSGTVLTVTTVTSGTVAVGQELDNLYGAVITANISGSGNGSTWRLSVPVAVASAGTPTAINLVADIVVTVTGSPTTANYKSGHMVNITGVVATTSPVTGTGTGLNWSYSIAVIDSTRFALIGTRAAYFGFTSYSNSGTIKRAPLQIRSVQGFKIFGGGRQATRIITDVSGGSVFASNGMEYGSVEGIGFEMAAGGAGGVAFDANWDNTNGAALQAITFRDCAFGGTSSTQGDGLRIGNCGAQGSEILVHNCHFTLMNVGLSTRNQNALLVNVLGGNVAQCNTGIFIVGSIDSIVGVSFQLNVSWDIDMASAGSFASGIYIAACRSERCPAEPGGFVRNQIGTHTAIFNCGAGGDANHKFVEFAGATTIIGCWSPTGRVYSAAGQTGSVCGINNRFDRSDFWQIGSTSGGTALTMGFNAERMQVDSSGNLNSATFASLPTAVANLYGAIVPVIDSTTNIPGAVITGSGSFLVEAFCNGTNWIVLPTSLVTKTVAQLPAASSALKGARVFVTDSTTVVFNASITTGGGSNQVPAVCNGTNWVVG